MKKLFLLGIVWFSSILVYAFSGQGSGTSDDPYLVSNADELFEVRNDLSAYYKQVDDIDLTTFIQEDNPKLGWAPIGTATHPFTGHYNGNYKSITGLYINRGSNNDIGLFGAISDLAMIEYLSIIHPIINGYDYVSAVVGHIYFDSKYPMGTYIWNVTVNGGQLLGHDHCASIVGGISQDSAYMSKNTIESSASRNYYIMFCYSSLSITATKSAAGICDIAQNGYINFSYNSIYSSSKNYYYTERIKAIVRDSRFDGRIKAPSCSGILNQIVPITHDDYYETASSCYSSYTNIVLCGEIRRCIMSGSLFSTGDNAYGITQGNQTYTGFEIDNNFSLADTLSAKTSIYRISGVSSTTNYALATSTLLVNQKEIEVKDDAYQGTSYGKKNLMKQGTYEGSGFQFGSPWKIKEGESYPYIATQSDPAIVTSFTAGSKGSISGTAVGTGKVYVSIGDNCYVSTVVDGQWNVTLGNTTAGTIALVSVAVNGYQASASVKAIATQSTDVTPSILGDANGDGTIDVSDVVGIVNYILGKPSDTFNLTNADANNDGQILVDDAVETINIITSQQ